MKKIKAKVSKDIVSEAVQNAKREIWEMASGQDYSLEEGIERGDELALKIHNALPKDNYIDGWKIEPTVNEIDHVKEFYLKHINSEVPFEKIDDGLKRYIKESISFKMYMCRLNMKAATKKLVAAIEMFSQSIRELYNKNQS